MPVRIGGLARFLKAKPFYKQITRSTNLPEWGRECPQRAPVPARRCSSRASPPRAAPLGWATRLWWQRWLRLRPPACTGTAGNSARSGHPRSCWPTRSGDRTDAHTRCRDLSRREGQDSSVIWVFNEPIWFLNSLGYFFLWKNLGMI